ncbi:hypothetical protein ON010_g12863 [Phytophthora cinnamomi]|nr:hypothetical protein ON010_g12863 [Phytophthora cinnamomi]
MQKDLWRDLVSSCRRVNFGNGLFQTLFSGSKRLPDVFSGPSALLSVPKRSELPSALVAQLSPVEAVRGAAGRERQEEGGTGAGQPVVVQRIRPHGQQDRGGRVVGRGMKRSDEKKRRKTRRRTKSASDWMKMSRPVRSSASLQMKSCLRPLAARLGERLVHGQVEAHQTQQVFVFRDERSCRLPV